MRWSWRWCRLYRWWRETECPLCAGEGRVHHIVSRIGSFVGVVIVLTVVWALLAHFFSLAEDAQVKELRQNNATLAMLNDDLKYFLVGQQKQVTGLFHENRKLRNEIEYRNSRITDYETAFKDGLYIAGARDEWEVIIDSMRIHFGYPGHIDGCSDEANRKLGTSLEDIANLGSLLFGE